MELFSPRTDYKSYAVPIIRIIILTIILLSLLLAYLFVWRDWLIMPENYLAYDGFIIVYGIFSAIYPVLIFRSIVEIMYARDNRKKQ